MGRPGRFHDGTRFKSYTGFAPRASETGQTDRKGQPMSKAGPSLLRATFFRAAGTVRRQDPQLANPAPATRKYQVKGLIARRRSGLLIVWPVVGPRDLALARGIGRSTDHDRVEEDPSLALLLLHLIRPVRPGRG